MILCALLALGVACGGGALIFGFGAQYTKDSAEPKVTDEELAKFLKPRKLTAAEMQEATLKGAFAHFRLPIK